MNKKPNKAIDWPNALLWIFCYFVMFGWALQVWISAAVIGCILAANYKDKPTKVEKEMYVPVDAEEKFELENGIKWTDKNGEYLYPEQVISKKGKTKARYEAEKRELDRKRMENSQARRIREKRTELFILNRTYSATKTFYFKNMNGEVSEIPFYGEPCETCFITTAEYYRAFPLFVKDLMVVSEAKRLEYGIDQKTYLDLLQRREKAIQEEKRTLLGSEKMGEYWELAGNIYGKDCLPYNYNPVKEKNKDFIEPLND